jgi:uncharacterized membrane protein
MRSPRGAYARWAMSELASDRPGRRRAWPRLRAEGDELRHLVGTRSGRVLVAAVVAVAILTLAGLLALWPYGWHPAGTPKSGTVAATVEKVTDAPCVVGTTGGVCRTIEVAVEGRHTHFQFAMRNAPSVGVGDHVRLLRIGDPKTAPAGDGFVNYEFAEVDRRGSLLWLAAVFAIAAAALLRWRGVLAVLGVVVSVAVLLGFVVPAMLAGKPALLVALVAALMVMFVTLVLTNGLGVQTLAAALGISATLIFTCALAYLAIHFTDLDGTSDLEMLQIKAGTQTLSLKGVILAGMVIGALGVLADTAVTQASAVMALRRANPRYSARRLYSEGFTIGRDHLSATIHTLVLAYAGATLPLLLTLRAGHVTMVDGVNAQSLAVPVVATLAGCLALMAAVPVCTSLATALLVRLPVDALPDGHGHHH